MLYPQGKKDVRGIHYDNLDRYEKIMEDYSQFLQGKLYRADRDNMYNKFLFSLCEQIDSYFDTAQRISQTAYYQNSQRFVDYDLPTREMMRGLLRETVSTMQAINDQFAHQDHKPFHRDFLAIADTIINDKPQTTLKSVLDMYSTIREICDTCDNSLAALESHIKADEKLFSTRSEREKDAAAMSDTKVLEYAKSIADAKMMLSLIDKGLQLSGQDAVKPLRLTQDEQRKLEALREKVSHQLEQIETHEKDFHYSLDLTPDGYLFKRSYLQNGPKCQLEYQQQQTLFDRHMHEKQTEITFNSFVHLDFALNNGLHYQVAIPIPSPIEDRHLVFNAREAPASAKQRLGEYTAAYKQGQEMGQSIRDFIEKAKEIDPQQLVETVQNIDAQQVGQAIKAIDPEEFLSKMKELVEGFGDWAGNIEVRIHGTLNGNDIDHSCSAPEAIIYGTQNKTLMEAKMRYDELKDSIKLRDFSESDWVDAKKNTANDMRKKAAKAIGKDTIGLLWKGTKSYFAVQSKPTEAVKTIEAFKNAAMEYAKTQSKQVWNTYQAVYDIMHGGQIPLDYETTLEKQAGRTAELFSETLIRDELDAEFAQHQEGNTRYIEGPSLYDDVYVMGYSTEEGSIYPKMSTSQMTPHEVAMMAQEFENQFTVIFAAQNAPEITDADLDGVEHEAEDVELKGPGE